MTAAGILLQARSTGRCLFLLRKDCDCWGTPGGHLDLGETLRDAAIREFREEVGRRSFTLCDAPVRHGGYALFYAEIARQFTPVLNEEHTDYVWACPEKPPQPLHVGLLYEMRKLGLG
jgi:ADP-ribose pyrophosphatase YjhB (NUDIX family)